MIIAWGAAHAQNGDTLEAGGTIYRLDGIDAPEIDQSCLDEKGKAYPCGRAASEALRELIAARKVYCQDLGADPSNPKRRIGQCYVDGTDVNHWLVEQGWALNFEPSARGRFKADETNAQAVRVGLWKGCFVAPSDFREGSRRGAKLLGASCPPDALDRLFPDRPQMPAGCAIKGKYALRAWPHRGIYHLPSCGSYQRTKDPERWFCTEDDAVAARFRKAYTCGWF